MSRPLPSDLTWPVFNLTVQIMMGVGVIRRRDEDRIARAVRQAVRQGMRDAWAARTSRRIAWPEVDRLRDVALRLNFALPGRGQGTVRRQDRILSRLRGAWRLGVAHEWPARVAHQKQVPR